MAGINKVILVGRLGKDPETKYMPSGDAVTSFSIATSENWKDKQTGEKREKTEWHNIVAFRRLGEICGEYLRKGSQVYLEGRLQTRKWQAQDGTDRYSTDIVANEMQMLGGRGADAAVTAPPPSPSEEDWGQGPKTKPAAAQPAAANDFDDDIPF